MRGPLHLVNESELHRRREGEDHRTPVARVRTMKPENITVELWAEAWQDLFRIECAPETRVERQRVGRKFARAHVGVAVEDVTPLMAQAWTNRHPRDLKTLRPMWQRAVLSGVAQYNVFRMVEVPRKPKIPRVPPTLEQLEAILGRCRELAKPDCPEWQVFEHHSYLWDHFADLVTFAAYTGARLGGCARLTRSEVDLEGGRVTLHEKGGKVRRAALLGPAHEALARACWQHRRRTTRGLVFMVADGKPISRTWVCKRWVRVRGEFDGPFHSLRHFAATWMLAQGASEVDVAVQLGHTDSLGRPYPELVRRVYGHPDPEDALARLEALVPRAGAETSPYLTRGELGE